MPESSIKYAWKQVSRLLLHIQWHYYYNSMPTLNRLIAWQIHIQVSIAGVRKGGTMLWRRNWGKGFDENTFSQKKSQMIRWSQREFKLHVIIIIIITCQESGNARKTNEWQKFIPDIKNERQKRSEPVRSHVYPFTCQRHSARLLGASVWILNERYAAFVKFARWFGTPCECVRCVFMWFSWN